MARALSQRPGLEGGDELALVDQAVLKREQSEEQVAVGGEAAMGRVSREPGTVVARSAPAPGACGRAAVDRLDYLMAVWPMQPRVRRSPIGSAGPAVPLRPRAYFPCRNRAAERSGAFPRQRPRPSRPTASRVRASVRRHRSNLG